MLVPGSRSTIGMQTSGFVKRESRASSMYKAKVLCVSPLTRMHPGYML